MVIGIISDTHDNISALREGIKILKDRGISCVFHLGDIISPFMVKEFDVPCVYAVFGNNDGDKLLLKERFSERGFRIFKGPHRIVYNGKKILMMHEPFQLNRFKREDFDLILFGHTHRVYIEEGKTLVINPGALSGYLAPEKTLVILDLNTMKPELITL